MTVALSARRQNGGSSYEKSLLNSAFWYSVCRNRILAVPAVACRTGRLRFGSLQNPGCSADRSEYDPRVTELTLLGDRRCKKAPSNGSIQLKATGSSGLP